MHNSKTPACVLVFAGLDPSGGAGIQADILTLAARGCHPLPIITSLTIQDTQNIHSLHPVEPQIVQQQVAALFNDMPIAAIKIGLLGSVQMAQAVAEILSNHPQIPVVFDPVLAAGGGAELSHADLLQCLRTEILPYTQVLTPNSIEARRLSQQQDLSQAALSLCEMGCEYVLITGTHEADDNVRHRCYQAGHLINEQECSRLKGSYHGSGCTLASAICAELAKGEAMEQALKHAQAYTWNSLQQGFVPGKGQFIPRRV